MKHTRESGNEIVKGEEWQLPEILRDEFIRACVSRATRLESGCPFEQSLVALYASLWPRAATTFDCRRSKPTCYPYFLRKRSRNTSKSDLISGRVFILVSFQGEDHKTAIETRRWKVATRYVVSCTVATLNSECHQALAPYPQNH